MENPAIGGGVKSENRDSAKTRAPAGAAAVAKVRRLVPGSSRCTENKYTYLL